jgi:hypothetical protein
LKSYHKKRLTFADNDEFAVPPQLVLGEDDVNEFVPFENDEIAVDHTVVHNAAPIGDTIAETKNSPNLKKRKLADNDDTVLQPEMKKSKRLVSAATAVGSKSSEPAATGKSV